MVHPPLCYDVLQSRCSIVDYCLCCCLLFTTQKIEKIRNQMKILKFSNFPNFAIFRDSIAQHCKQIRFINPSPNDLTEAKMRNEFVNTGGFLSRILYISVWNVPPESQKTSIYKRLVDALLKRIQQFHHCSTQTLWTSNTANLKCSMKQPWYDLNDLQRFF